MKIGIFGRGRLGRALEESLGPEAAWIAGRGDSPPGAAVAIDASGAAGVEGHLEWALATGSDLVIAATGWELADLEARVGGRIGVLVAPNGSLTIPFLVRLAALLRRFARTQVGADLFLVDHHHRAKVDAPSGTALRLAAALQGGEPAPPVVVSCLRAGHEIGCHTLGFDAPGEVVEIQHRVRSRAVFADGLIAAARWLHRQRGVFTLDDYAASILDPIFEGVEP